jgi:chromosome segregation ATPase
MINAINPLNDPLNRYEETDGIRRTEDGRSAALLTSVDLGAGKQEKNDEDSKTPILQKGDRVEISEEAREKQRAQEADKQADKKKNEDQENTDESGLNKEANGAKLDGSQTGKSSSAEDDGSAEVARLRKMIQEQQKKIQEARQKLNQAMSEAQKAENDAEKQAAEQKVNAAQIEINLANAEIQTLNSQLQKAMQGQSGGGNSIQPNAGGDSFGGYGGNSFASDAVNR